MTSPFEERESHNRAVLAHSCFSMTDLTLPPTTDTGGWPYSSTQT